jgi:hypothetical protein
MRTVLYLCFLAALGLLVCCSTLVDWCIPKPQRALVRIQPDRGHPRPSS